MRLVSDQPEDLTYLQQFTWVPGPCEFHRDGRCTPELATRIGDMAICWEPAAYRLLPDRLDANSRWTPKAPPYRPDLAAMTALAA